LLDNEAPPPSLIKTFESNGKQLKSNQTNETNYLSASNNHIAEIDKYNNRDKPTAVGEGGFIIEPSISYSLSKGSGKSYPRDSLSNNKDNNNDNFVRKNLNKRFTGSRHGKSKKSSVRFLKSSSFDHSNLDLISNEGGIGIDNDHTELNNPNNNEANLDSTFTSGLIGWGLDPLDLSLTALKSCTKNRHQSTNNENLRGACGQNNFSSKLIKNRSEAKCIRGLEDKNKISTKSKAPRIKSAFDDDTLQRNAPDCSGHQMPAKLLTVKKSGNNHVGDFNLIIIVYVQKITFVYSG
jgi:hypothetical protein